VLLFSDRTATAIASVTENTPELALCKATLLTKLAGTKDKIFKKIEKSYKTKKEAVK